MKKQILLAAVAFFLSMSTLFAQAPDLFNYQGVARNASGQALSGQAIKLRLVMRQGSSTGSVLYTEDHSVTTNTYGLYNVKVGDGTPISNTFSNIDWSNGDKYLQVRIDPNGGSTFTDVGRTQLLSVPFALYAKEVAPKQVISFRAEGSPSSGSVTSGTSPIFSSQVHDDGNNYNPTTGEFTVPEDGVYVFNVSVVFASMSTPAQTSVGFFINTNTEMNWSTPSSSTAWSGKCAMTIKLSQGDVVKPRIYTAGTLNFGSNGGYNHFTGYKIN